MKSFKKALAVLLSVLMVVFSFPFSAMALDNPNLNDGSGVVYCDDTDVVMHLYAMPYTGAGKFGPASDVYDEAGVNYDPGKTYDFNNITVDAIAADYANCDTASGLNRATFCLVVTMENFDPGYNIGQFVMSYDTAVVQACYIKNNNKKAASIVTGSAADTSAVLRESSYWDAEGNINTETHAYKQLPDGSINVNTEVIFQGGNWASTTLWDDNAEYEMQGQVVCVVGFELLQDSADLSQVFHLNTDISKTYWTKDTEDPGNNYTEQLVPYGVTDSTNATAGKDVDLSKLTVFTCPELGMAPAETSKDVTYTYTFANGTSTTVKAAEGTEPTAPDNTPTAIASNGDGTHTTTSYSWPAFAQGTTAYTEVATPSTVPCTKEVDAQAVAPGHTTPGSTEAWHCSVCNYKVDSTTVGATGHTWDAGVVTPATCTAQGYTTYTCTAGDGGTLVGDYTDPDPNNHTAVVTDAAVPATCTSTGLTEGSHCTACGKTVVAQTETPIDSSNHTNVVTDKAVDPTCTDPGRTAGSHCQACGTVITAQQEVPALKHDWKVTSSTDATCKTAGTVTSECSRCHETKTETGVLDPSNHEGPIVDDAAVPATCTSTGLTAGTHCSACGAIVVAQTETPINPSNHVGNTVKDEAVPATCTSTGLTEGSHCDACQKAIVAQNVIPIDSSNHTNVVKDDAVDPTCTTPGRTEGSHCTACGTVIVAQQTINALDHAWDEGVVTKEATRAEDGVKTFTCSRDASHKKTEAIPALGVQITVTANELGTTTLNGMPTTGAAQKVAYESTYTLKATANEGAEFVGWMVNGKMVSTNAVYTTGAYADLTYVPVFAPKAAVDFVVTFIDQFNKVIATIASSELAGLIELPSAPDYPHYTFEGYDLSLDEVKALKDSTVVTASYAKDATTYTVTAYGCTITVDGVDYQETATVAHDARVTVKPNSDDVAKSWTVNSSQAAFGSEYSFYVTANVEVAYSTLDVTAAPTVANVSMDQIDDVKVRFLATRSVTDGYTLLESGFVYGKDMNSADLVLENVNGTTCRVMKNSNMAADGQFALTVGIASKTGKLGVAAYIIVKDSAGTVSAIYAPVQEWTY